MAGVYKWTNDKKDNATKTRRDAFLFFWQKTETADLHPRVIYCVLMCACALCRMNFQCQPPNGGSLKAYESFHNVHFRFVATCKVSTKLHQSFNRAQISLYISNWNWFIMLIVVIMYSLYIEIPLQNI